MTVRAGNRVIEYNLPESLTLDDIRQIVKETESIRGDARVTLPRTAGQRDAEYVKFVVTEDWPPRDA